MLRGLGQWLSQETACLANRRAWVPSPASHGKEPPCGGTHFVVSVPGRQRQVDLRGSLDSQPSLLVNSKPMRDPAITKNKQATRCSVWGTAEKVILWPPHAPHHLNAYLCPQHTQTCARAHTQRLSCRHSYTLNYYYSLTPSAQVNSNQETVPETLLSRKNIHIFSKLLLIKCWMPFIAGNINSNIYVGGILFLCIMLHIF